MLTKLGVSRAGAVLKMAMRFHNKGKLCLKAPKFKGPISNKVGRQKRRIGNSKNENHLSTKSKSGF